MVLKATTSTPSAAARERVTHAFRLVIFVPIFQMDALGHNLVDIKKVKFGDCDLGDNCLNPVPDVCYTHDQRSQCGGPNATEEVGWYDLQ